MKKLFLLIISIALISCEGPAGPPGFDGINILGNVFDVSVDFTPNNGYSSIIAFPNNIEVFESDVVMVYLLEEQLSDPTGPIDVWSPLPQTFFLNDGTQVVYNFNHTFLDVSLFLDGNVNLDSLGIGFTNNQIFRIAILPADFAEQFGVNIENYSEVIQVLEAQNADFEVIDRKN
jgi:hypothetical protein